MNYRELQKALGEYKAQGLTEVALNASKEILQVEYDRLTPTVTEETKEELTPVVSQAVSCISGDRVKFVKGGGHVTATERDYIKQGLALGANEWTSPRKRFKVHSFDGSNMEIRIYENMSNSYGKMYENWSRANVIILPEEKKEEIVMPNEQIVKIEDNKITFKKLGGAVVTETINNVKQLRDKVINYIDGRRDLHKIAVHFEKLFPLDSIEHILSNATEYDREYAIN
jgi:hypothetical protein